MALGQIEMDMGLVMAVGTGSEHGGETRAGARADGLAQFLGHGGVGQAEHAVVGEREGAHVDRVALAVLGKLGAVDRGCVPIPRR